MEVENTIWARARPACTVTLQGDCTLARPSPVRLTPHRYVPSLSPSEAAVDSFAGSKAVSGREDERSTRVRGYQACLRALRAAKSLDPLEKGIPSSKGVI